MDVENGPEDTGRGKGKHLTKFNIHGRETQEGRDMGIYVELIHFVTQQKLTHHCKAIILQ